MQSSEKTDNIILALRNAQSEFETVKRTVTNDFFGSKYATLDDILEMVKPVLHKNDLVLMQSIETQEDGQPVIETRIWHTSGEWLSATVKMPEIDQKGANVLQEFGISVTYMRRYTLSSFLGISVEDDNDGNKPQKRNVKVDSPGEVEVTFGKYKGKTLEQIWDEDSGYVRWLADKARDGFMQAVAAQFAQSKESESTTQPFDVNKVTKATFKNDWDAMLDAALEHLPSVTDKELAKEAIKARFEKATVYESWCFLRDEFGKEPEPVNEEDIPF